MLPLTILPLVNPALPVVRSDLRIVVPQEIVPADTLGSHPAPVIVTVMPAAPVLGVKVMVGDVTVNDAVCVLFVGVASSATVIVYDPPAVVAGIVKVTDAGIAPAPEVVAPATPLVYSCRYVPFSASDNLLVAANALPESVTVLPAGAAVGLSVIVGTTVIFCVYVFPCASVIAIVC